MGSLFDKYEINVYLDTIGVTVCLNDKYEMNKRLFRYHWGHCLNDKIMISRYQILLQKLHYISMVSIAILICYLINLVCAWSEIAFRKLPFGRLHHNIQGRPHTQRSCDT